MDKYSKEIIRMLGYVAGFGAIAVGLYLVSQHEVKARYDREKEREHKNVVVDIKENTKVFSTDILLRDVKTGAERGFQAYGDNDARSLHKYLYVGDTVSIYSRLYDNKALLSSGTGRLVFNQDSIRARQEREKLQKYKENFVKQR